MKKDNTTCIPSINIEKINRVTNIVNSLARNYYPNQNELIQGAIAQQKIYENLIQQNLLLDKFAGALRNIPSSLAIYNDLLASNTSAIKTIEYFGRENLATIYRLTYSSALTLSQNLTPRVNPQILDFIGKLDYSYLKKAIHYISCRYTKLEDNFEEEIVKMYAKSLYEAKWFPAIGTRKDLDIALNLIEEKQILKSDSISEDSIDSVILYYYSDMKIEQLKKQWKKTNQPKFRKQIFNNCLDAFLRKEYALTFCTLIPMWEGILNEKKNGKYTRATKISPKQCAKQVIPKDTYYDLLVDFVDEFVYKKCDETTDHNNTCNRHMVCHSWIDKYPTKKEALNTILFTDYLLHLEDKNPTNIQE